MSLGTSCATGQYSMVKLMSEKSLCLCGGVLTFNISGIHSKRINNWELRIFKFVISRGNVLVKFGWCSLIFD